VRAMRYAVEWYKAFAEETTDKRSPIVQAGYLFLHDDEAAWKDAQERVVMQRSAGVADVEALAAAALVDRFPWVDGEAVLGGTWCPSDGFLFPEVVYQEGARRVRELGGRLVQGAEVTGADRDGGRLTAVHTTKGTYAADLFVDCTNAWTRRTAALLGAAPLPVDPLKRYLWFLKRGGPMSGEVLSAMPLVIAPTGVYCRPENAHTLMVGWAHDAAPEPAFSYDDQDAVDSEFSHKGGIETRPYEAWMHLAEVIPDFGEFDGVTATTAGYYGTTPDHNPFLGYDPATSNLLRLVGFSGHGAMFGPFTARVAAALAEAGRDVAEVELPGGERVSIAAFAPAVCIDGGGAPCRLSVSSAFRGCDPWPGHEVAPATGGAANARWSVGVRSG
jgi:sarcosine oxidase subunit beta